MISSVISTNGLAEGEEQGGGGDGKVGSTPYPSRSQVGVLWWVKNKKKE